MWCLTIEISKILNKWNYGAVEDVECTFSTLGKIKQNEEITEHLCQEQKCVEQH